MKTMESKLVLFVTGFFPIVLGYRFAWCVHAPKERESYDHESE
jgi:hypothetical protein